MYSGDTRLNVLCTCSIYSSSMKNGHKGIILIQVDLHPVPESRCLQPCSRGRTVTSNKSRNISLGARWRERCILLKDHDQFPILYIPPFFPYLQAYQKHNIMYTRTVPTNYFFIQNTYLSWNNTTVFSLPDHHTLYLPVQSTFS